MTFRRVACAHWVWLSALPSPIRRNWAHRRVCRGSGRRCPITMPINPVHLALMNNGKVLIVVGLGQRRGRDELPRGGVGPAGRQIIVTQPVAWDMFCNGMVVLPDGRVFINGGNLQYDPFHGEPRNAGLRSRHRALHRRAEHGARPVVSDRRRRSATGG